MGREPPFVVVGPLQTAVVQQVMDGPLVGEVAEVAVCTEGVDECDAIRVRTANLRPSRPEAVARAVPETSPGRRQSGRAGSSPVTRFTTPPIGLARRPGGGAERQTSTCENAPSGSSERLTTSPIRGSAGCHRDGTLTCRSVLPRRLTAEKSPSPPGCTTVVPAAPSTRLATSAVAARVSSTSRTVTLPAVARGPQGPRRVPPRGPHQRRPRWRRLDPTHGIPDTRRRVSDGVVCMDRLAEQTDPCTHGEREQQGWPSAGCRGRRASPRGTSPVLLPPKNVGVDASGPVSWLLDRPHAAPSRVRVPSGSCSVCPQSQWRGPRRTCPEGRTGFPFHPGP